MRLRLPRKLTCEIPGQSCRALPACQSVEKGHEQTNAPRQMTADRPLHKSLIGAAAASYMKSPSPNGEGERSPRCKDQPLVVRANGIDDGRLLANEQMPRAMNCQAALLLGRLGRHKPNVWPVTASQIASASVASFLCHLT